ncbi:hypothetical protein V5799_013421 [Amblyomma americanum]|uniref:Uncharacterized protein n=1 Tax=Amblyomma americanum TaxID=6943 RepID=A0AAQ4E621_AMBAM
MLKVSTLRRTCSRRPLSPQPVLEFGELGLIRLQLLFEHDSLATTIAQHELPVLRRPGRNREETTPEFKRFLPLKFPGVPVSTATCVAGSAEEERLRKKKRAAQGDNGRPGVYSPAPLTLAKSRRLTSPLCHDDRASDASLLDRCASNQETVRWTSEHKIMASGADGVPRQVGFAAALRRRRRK